MTGKFDKKKITNNKDPDPDFNIDFFQAFSYLWHLSVHFTMPIQLSHVRCHEMVVVHLGLYSLSWSIWQLASVSFILCLKTKNSTNGTFSKNNFFYEIHWLYYFSAVFMRVCSVTSLSELLWTAGVNDFVLKFISVIIKIGIILVPSHVLQHRKRVIFF